MTTATFAGTDVTSIVKSLQCPFEVSIVTLGDPQPCVYKFLTLTRDAESVLVGEGDVILKLEQSVALPPMCQQLAPLDKYILKKRGLWLESVKPCEHEAMIVAKARKIDFLAHGLNDEKKEETTDIAIVKRNGYDFVFCSDVLLYARNPLSLLCVLHNTLRDGGYFILMTPSASQPSLSETVASKRFEPFLQIFDAKIENVPLSRTDIKPNCEFDFNLLRAFLRFSMLIPVYSQQHLATQVIVARKLTPTPSPMAVVQQKSFFDTLPKDITFCPHCGEMYCKDDNCSYVYCGLQGDNVFRVGYGCGKCFCFTCGKKYCGQHYDPKTGAKLDSYRDTHDDQCCAAEDGFQQDDFCRGGHSPHCPKRW